jgi:hypothetical protein
MDAFFYHGDTEHTEGHGDFLKLFSVFLRVLRVSVVIFIFTLHH